MHPLPIADPASLDELLELPVLSCRICLRFTERASLPPYKASTLRGALGHALRAVVCQQPERAVCAGCPLLSACSYPWLFEGHVARPNPWFQQTNASPPFRLQVPDEELDVVRPGDGLDVRLTVYGEGIAFTSLLLRSLDEAGERLGLGRDRSQGAGRFQRLWVRAEDGERELARGRDLPERLQAQTLGSLLRPLAGPWRRLLLATPLQWKRAGRLWTDPSLTPALEDWAESVQRRLYLLNWHLRQDFHRAPPERPRPGGRLLARDLRLEELRRYSQRDHTYKSLEGLTGWLLYHVDDERHDALLAAAEWLGVGRQTVMGLGDVAVVDR